ncbi:MAG TPA: carboxypeptidase-like regulatory domain-containing protein [Gemmatimonadales bacterium]|nr:carboxypeptidase-like regulatory domain-containing protein [Gemmatimonadales bacterium]
MKICLEARVRRLLFLCAGLAMIAACSDGSGPAFGTCRQTGEFGNYGCAKVEGVARSPAGAPLAGVQVTLSAAENSGAFDAPVDETDETGSYSLEMHDYGGSPSGGPTSDTVAANLYAYHLTDPLSTPSLGGPVPVQLTFVPLGELPEVVEVDITIDVIQ